MCLAPKQGYDVQYGFEEPVAITKVFNGQKIQLNATMKDIVSSNRTEEIEAGPEHLMS